MTMTTMALGAAPVVNIIGSILILILVAGIIFVGVRFYGPIKDWIARYSLIKLFNDLLAETKDPEYQKALADIKGFYEDYRAGKITLEQLKQKIFADTDILFVLMKFVSIISAWAKQFAKG